MRPELWITRVAVLGVLVASVGCATKGQLRRGLDEQAAALSAERAERVAGDERLAGEMSRMRGDVEGLRRDLDALNAEFGTRITMLEDGMQFAVPVHFGFDRADLDADARPVLDRFSEVARKYYAGARITVEGFADPAGSAAYNRRLSQRRADAVRQYLVSSGVPAAQLAIVGYGEERPVVPGAAGATFGAELNRRVVFVVETPPDSTLLPAGQVSSR